MNSIGIIGYGAFGQFMAKHLMPHFNVLVYNRSNKSREAEEHGTIYTSLQKVASCDAVIISVPVQNFEEILHDIKNFVRPGTLVIDVASVKVKPVKLMLDILPETVEIVATHPLFGPQSGNKGIKGLKCVVCDIRSSRIESLKEFLTKTLELRVIEMTPEQHDIEIAYVQGLTHWISRAVRNIEMPEGGLSTPAYEHLLEIGRILGDDSTALFLTIQRENPHAAIARGSLLNKLIEIDKMILYQENQ